LVAAEQGLLNWGLLGIPDFELVDFALESCFEAGYSALEGYSGAHCFEADYFELGGYCSELVHCFEREGYSQVGYSEPYSAPEDSGHSFLDLQELEYYSLAGQELDSDQRQWLVPVLEQLV
jgi:hypothetical protein